ncbi:MAG: heat-inducible transcriptional repressor HrcA [Oscillospiraceae bacterium]|jgi:heat-inducible transcriptional repressor|nr:heat-inducible transcriptional repressor HrcA [Oscillospiraceae bacterium]
MRTWFVRELIMEILQKGVGGMEMDERKLRILHAIIDDYILTAIPVGSRTITKKYDVGGLSSATIRNEMSDLEALGYLDQPHTSAGRIPSAKAYRLYVESLLQNSPQLSALEASKLRGHLRTRERQLGELIRRAADAVAGATNYTTVVAGPKALDMRVKSVQLVQVASETALMILVTDAAVFKDTTVSVDPELSPEDLFQVSRLLTDHLSGRLISDMGGCLNALLSVLGEHTRLMQTVLDALGRIELEATTTREIAVSGGTNILHYPEYSDTAKARAFLNALETREKLRALLTGSQSMAFTLRIGLETGMSEMEDCAVVTASYQVSGDHLGTIGVIGPARMRYGHVLSVLNCVGKSLSELLNG